VFCSALFVFSLTALVRAQSTSASVTGHVSDPSQALVVNAVIAAINADTNGRYATTTNSSGEYRLANLPPGMYRIEIQKPGFKKLVKPDVILHVQDALSIDLEMTLGARSEIVTVEAGAPIVNTESGTVSSVIDRTFIENLPLNGRSFQNLMLLTPGVVLTATAFDDQGQFSVNGQRADANYFTVDGVSANFGVTGYPVLAQTASESLPALTASGGTNSLVSMDAMQEFRIQTSSFAPEFGRTPGGQISVVTRSGTNAFHGTLSEYFRNSALDAADWFVNYNRLQKPEERLNDFGGVAGGPVVKDRTFFFFSYEGLRLRQPALQQTVVPDTASREEAPAAMRPYLNVYPIPNGPELAVGLAQFSASYSNPSTLDAYSLRIDQVVNSRLNFFVRYNYSPSRLVQRASLSSVPVLSMTQSVSSTVQTATTGFTHLITPAISNEVRANYSNHRMDLKYNMDNFGGAVPIPDSLLFPSGYSSANGIFFMYIAGSGQVAQGKLGIDEQRQVNLIDNLSVTRGGHQLKFGVDYRWLSPISSPFSYRQYIQFSGVTEAAGGVLSGTAAIAQAGAYQPNVLLSQNFSIYSQDTWKITRRFTVTYGLRWDVNPPLKGKNAANDPFTVTGLNNLATIALAPRGTPLYQTTYENVAPRVGLAWQLGGKPNWVSTLRAGFGVFHDLGQGGLGATTSYFPYFTNRTIPQMPTPFPLSPQNAAPPAFTLNPPVSNIIVADPRLKLPRTWQWNVALEQSIGGSQTLCLTYIGAIGRNLLRPTNLFNVNPDFQYISLNG
jgi:hypothetical protein